MSRSIRTAASGGTPTTVPRTRAAGTALVFALTVLSAGSLRTQTLAAADGTSRRPGITVTNAVPEFTLTLPDRYASVKQTGDALYTFGTTDQAAGSVVGVYRLGHTIEQGADVRPQVQAPDARMISATWKLFPVDVHAWHTTAKNGAISAARWVQIPLQQEAVSILVLIPVEKEALADGLLQDFLSGLDGPTNWKIEQPLTTVERAERIALGLGLALVLLAGPPLTLRIWQRYVARQMALNSASAHRLRNFAAAMATPALNQPRYWLRVLAVVFAVIAAALAYLTLTAAAFSLIFNWTFGDSFKAIILGIELLCLIASVLVLGFWISSLRRRGHVLLDFGPDPMRAFFLAVGLFCLFAAIFSGGAALMNLARPQWSTLLLAPLQLTIAIQFLIRVTGRVQITESGIWQNLNLLRWETIGSYRWIDDATLLVARGPGLPSLKLPVPPAHKRAFNELLSQHGLAEAAV
jgi:hypothetical protein